MIGMEEIWMQNIETMALNVKISGILPEAL
jgi:hypothetical protein